MRCPPAVPGGHFALTARHGEKGVFLDMQDNSAGIAADNQPYLFDRFYRLDRARQNEMGASGLGLAIASVLVDSKKLELRTTRG